MKYDDGKIIIDRAKNAIELIRRYDLCSKDNINTHIIELQGEQEAIAISNYMEG